MEYGYPSRSPLRYLRQGGLGLAREALAWTYFRYFRRVNGLNVYDREWDVLVILDACRADLMAEVIGDYDWLTMEEEVTSVGGASVEWIEKTFGQAPEHELENTAYITGNPFSSDHLDAGSLGRVEEVWRWGWDDDLRTIPARPVTDQAVRTAREGSFDRIIVHYMQPHFPCVPRPREDEGKTLGDFGHGFQPTWDKVRLGQKSVEEAWKDYRENLRYVLEDVALLRENVDADRMVVTADHGNAVGEHGIYGHDNGLAHPKVRTVPWCVTSGEDRETHEPSAGNSDAEVDEEELEERLAALGYR